MTSLRARLLHPVAIAVYSAAGTLLSLFLGRKATKAYRDRKARRITAAPAEQPPATETAAVTA